MMIKNNKIIKNFNVLDKKVVNHVVVDNII